MKIEIELNEEEILRLLNSIEFAVNQINDYEATAAGLPEDAQKDVDVLKKLAIELNDNVDGNLGPS